MRFRKLRIAFSTSCGITCLLLVFMWTRSYLWLDVTPYRQLSSAKGWLYVNQTLNVPEGISNESTMDFGFWKMPFSRRQSIVPAGPRGWAMPYWPVVVTSSFLTAAPWLSCRYSLRTLLIATTLVAIGLGLAVFAARV